jgi:hypothetical protein
MTRDVSLCGRPETLIAKGTEVELVGLNPTTAIVKPNDSVWQQ